MKIVVLLRHALYLRNFESALRGLADRGHEIVLVLSPIDKQVDTTLLNSLTHDHPNIRQEPIGARRPGVIYGLGNLVENAIDFARDKVEISAVWSAREVTISIADDGQGIPPDVMDALGEPYITTRPSRSGETGQDGEASGLGLGFFIAKTLLERSGATVSLENREFPATGAVATVSWPRESFVNQQAATQSFVERRAEALGASLESGIR